METGATLLFTHGVPPLSFARLGGRINARLADLGVSLQATQLDDSVIGVFEGNGAVLQIESLHAALPEAELAPAMASSFGRLQCEGYDFAARIADHTGHMLIRLEGHGPAPASALRRLMMLHQVLASILEEHEPTVIYWHQSGVLLHADQLRRIERYRLPLQIMFRPDIIQAPVETNQPARLGIVAKHTGALCGKTLVLVPNRLEIGQQIELLAYLIKQNLSGDLGFEDGSWYPLERHATLYFHHLPPSRKYPEGRVLIAFERDLRRPARQTASEGPPGEAVRRRRPFPFVRRRLRGLRNAAARS